MPNARWTAVALAGTGLISVLALSVPDVRHALFGLLPDPRHLPRRHLASDDIVVAPREAAPGRAGPAGLEGPSTAREADAPSGPTVAATDPDAPLVRRAVDAYRRGDLAAGDAFGRAATRPIARLTIEWASLRLLPREAGPARMSAFLDARPDWPAAAWLKRRLEEAVAADADSAAVTARFSAVLPQTVAGKTALARAERAQGRVARAADIVRQVWREEDLSGFQEALVLRDFGDLLGRDDHWVRAERLLYKEQTQAALKEAALAGPDVVALAKARAAVIANAPSDAAVAAVPKALQSDPGLIFSRIQKARRANKIADAADLMLSAPRDPAKIIDGDEWWVERRLVARKLLDAGDARKAYRICAEHSAVAAASRIEAEFHAGWIALRFLDDPETAAGHFARAAATAETPMSRSRAAYWRARAAESAGKAEEAARFYADAARYSTSFYGQVSAARIGGPGLALRVPAPPATGDARSEAVRVAEFLFASGSRDIALPLALDIARNEPSEAQVGALAAVTEKLRDAPATLLIGKAATQRGMALDETAFPTFGVPPFQPLPNSADLAVVYAIARQESEFEPRSSSSAGAKGLMQMIASTARRTAEQAGIGFDEARLSSDAAFNAQLGAAHLGTLLDEQGGSFILTFAAYNAGGRNVKAWIDAYGDPRKPGVDPIDWIERIPFTETRNYVQRVLENLQVYRVRLGRTAPTLIGNNIAAPGRT